MISLLLIVSAATSTQAAPCPDQGVGVQILGSGGTRLSSDRASSSFLIRKDNHALIMVNVGGGSALRFSQSGANISDLKAILLTNVQADSTAALPALVQMSINKHRNSPLQVYGPGGYKTVPSTVALVRALFEVSGGAYRELGKVLAPLDKDGFKLRPHNIDIKFKDDQPVFDKNKTRTTVLVNKSIRLSATPVDRDGTPALAWRVDINDKSVVFAGKTMASTDHLRELARGAQVLVIAAPSGDGKSISLANIGRLATHSGIGRIILTNLPALTKEAEKSMKDRITPLFKGEVLLAKDLDCIKL